MHFGHAVCFKPRVWHQTRLSTNPDYTFYLPIKPKLLDAFNLMPVDTKFVSMAISKKIHCWWKQQSNAALLDSKAIDGNYHP